jgi:cobalamin synthase
VVAAVVTVLLLLLNTGCVHFNPLADSHAAFLMGMCNRKLALILPDFYPAGEEEVVVVVVTLWLVSCWVGLYLVPLATSLLPRYSSCIANPSDDYSRTACRNGLHRM